MGLERRFGLQRSAGSGAPGLEGAAGNPRARRPLGPGGAGTRRPQSAKQSRAKGRSRARERRRRGRGRRRGLSGAREQGRPGRGRAGAAVVSDLETGPGEGRLTAQERRARHCCSRCASKGGSGPRSIRSRGRAHNGPLRVPSGSSVSPRTGGGPSRPPAVHSRCGAPSVLRPRGPCVDLRGCAQLLPGRPPGSARRRRPGPCGPSSPPRNSGRRGLEVEARAP